MKRLICALLVMVTVLSMWSCNKDDVDGGETTTAETTEYDYNKIPDVIEPHERKLVTASELGLSAYLTDTEKYYIADARVEKNGDITLTSYNPGSTVITVKNSYGEEMKVAVTVGLDYNFESVSIEKFKMPEKYVNAKDYGMDPQNEDNAEYLQAAIDALPHGGIVYVPKGTYHSTFVQIKEGIKLRLEGILPEYNTEFTSEIANMISEGNTFATIVAVNGDMFANHEKGGYGRYGADNFEITGGVLDMAGKSRCFIWCCAENVLLENVIMKDCCNDHAIQVTGCKNVTIRNVMFAGYKKGSNVTTAELIQIESSHPGAIGTATVAATKFDDNEFYSCENVTIENCYFGKSDENDSATFFIGHHVHNAGAEVTGLRILACTFDNPRVVAIRAYAYSDVEISECAFISDEENMLVEESRFMIELTLATGAKTLPSGAYLATAETRGGCQGFRIHDNEFYIGDDSGFAGFIKTLSFGITDYDAKGYYAISESDFYTETPKSFTGYKLVTNRISDIRIYDNSFTVENDESDTLFDLVKVMGVEFGNNSFNIPSGYVADEMDGVEYEGARLSSCRSLEYCEKNFRISADCRNKSVPIIFVSGDDEIESYCTGTDTGRSYILTVTCEEGGVIKRYVDEDGALFVEAVADEGYEFVGYTVDGEELSSGKFNFSSSTTVSAVFAKKK